MDNEKLIEFLTELTKLTNKYGFWIGGCGCCGSPWVISNSGDVGNYLDYDEEKDCYSLDLYDGYEPHDPIYVYGNKEDGDVK